jgi:hypothetical protein
MLYMPHMAWAVVYYETAQGDTLIEAFLDALSHGARAKCLAYISRLEVMGCIQDPNATVGEKHEPDCASSEFSVAER